MDDFLGSIAIAAIFSKGFAVLFAIVLMVCIIGFVGMSIGAKSAYDEAFERGYMEYCSHDGVRRWLGECGDATNDQ